MSKSSPSVLPFSARPSKDPSRLLKLFRETNEQLLDDFRKNSPQLAILAEDLPEWLRRRGNDQATKAEVIYFIEELTKCTIGKVRYAPGTYI